MKFSIDEFNKNFNESLAFFLADNGLGLYFLWVGLLAK